MFMTVKQASEKWGISDRRVRILCAEGKIAGAHPEGRGWKIPVDARKPADGRYKSKESLLAQIARKEDVPEKTLFIITTDGMENASHHYTYDKVRHMIERQKERYGWEFLFLGANIDAAAEAKRFGIDESMAANYHCDEVGTVLNYEVISEAITNVRASKAPLSADWKKKIDADYRKRGGKR